MGKIEWFFREQPISDQGVDAIVEDVDMSIKKSGRTREEGTGRLLALQIKAGSSYFSRHSPDGWWFRFDQSHARRWLSLPMPVVVVLVDVKNDACYWQEISSRTIVKAGKGFKVEVPSAQTVVTAAPTWRVLASKASAVAVERYANSLEHLPPAVSKVIGEMSPAHSLDAAMLAFHLAEGRHNPEGTVEALLTAEPPWVQRDAQRSWTAIAAYASCHEEHSLSADAYEKAARAASSENAVVPTGRLLANAAIQLLTIEHGRAAHLVDEAEKAGAAEHVVLVTRAVLGHTRDDAHAVPIPQGLDREADQVRKSPFVQSFLAIQAQRSGDVEGALTHSALAWAEDSDSAVTMVHRADILLWAALVGHPDTTLRLEGMRLLREAIEQRHRWDGPTLEPTREFARAALLEGRLTEVLDVCLGAPVGQAGDEDAADPLIQRLALAAAAGLHREDLAARISAGMGDESADHLSRYRVGLTDATLGQRRQWLEDDLADAVASKDHGRAAGSSLELAELGANATAAIGDLVERGILPSETPRLLAALATAHSDLDQALPELRALARINQQAAGALIDLLQSAGRHREALAACETALAVRRSPPVVASRADLLIRLDAEDAEAEAVAASTELHGFPVQRRKFLTFAASKAVDRGDLDAAEMRLQDAIAIPEPNQPSAIWNLVWVQLQSGRVGRARYTIEKHSPEIRDATDARQWLQAHLGSRLDAAKAAVAIETAERLNHPEVSSALLTLVIMATNGIDDGPPDAADQAGLIRELAVTDDGDQEATEDPDDVALDLRRRQALTSVPGELHQQAYAGLQRLVDEHGDSAPVEIIRGDDAQLIQQITEMVRQSADRDRVIGDYAERAQDAQVPIGVVAALAGRSYASTLIRRSLGLLPAASADESEHDLDVDTARQALSGDVVAETSALLTSTAPLDIDLLATFSSVTVAAESLRDIYRASADIRGASGSPGSLSLDLYTGLPTITPLSTDEYLRQLRRLEQLTDQVKPLPSRAITNRTALPEMADQPQFHTWTDPIELAAKRQLPLWSDDLGLRRVARQAGIATFGTPALLTALNEMRLENTPPDDLDSLLGSAANRINVLAADLLVDLQLGFGDVTRLAEADSWQPGAGALAVSRPSWWAWSHRRDEVSALLASVRSERPEALPLWLAAAMHGAARAAVDPAGRSRILCTLAFLAWNPFGDISALKDGIETARMVCRRRGYEDPANELRAVAESLLTQAENGLPATHPRPTPTTGPDLTVELLAAICNLSDELAQIEDGLASSHPATAGPRPHV